MIGALLVVAAQLAAADAALEQCRKLDREFDSKNMPKACQAAADNAAAPVDERVEALRLLAFAHILNGDEALAEPVFVRMLVFAPSAELPADAGPQFRSAFATARKRFDLEGQVSASVVAPVVVGADRTPVTLQVDLVDKLGRVVAARVRATTPGAPAPLEQPLAKSELGPGQLRFTGSVPEPASATAYPLSWEVVLEGWDGAPVPLASALSGTFAREARGGGTGDGDTGELPWAWIVGGGAASVVVVGAAAGGVAWCFVAGPCRPQNAWVRVQIAQGASP